MFWTKITKQLSLFGDDEYHSSDVVRELLRMAAALFPDDETDWHRVVAFLSHKATQNFLGPLLKMKYGSIDSAKEDTVAWMRAVGSLESYARGTRHNGDSTAHYSPRDGTEPRQVPDWYTTYARTARYRSMVKTAEESLADAIGPLTCSENARHPYEVMHHRDYGRLGCHDEYKYMIPKCHECHNAMRKYGPSVPYSAPEEVKQWL